MIAIGCHFMTSCDLKLRWCSEDIHVFFFFFSYGQYISDYYTNSDSTIAATKFNILKNNELTSNIYFGHNIKNMCMMLLS